MLLRFLKKAKNMGFSESESDRSKRRALVRMFLAFPSSEKSTDQVGRIRVYLEALHRIPLFFVEEAVTYVIRGRLSHGFLPTAGELVQLSEELQSRAIRSGTPKFKHPWEKDYANVHNTPEQRERIIAGFKELLQDLRSGKAIYPDKATANVFWFRRED